MVGKVKCGELQRLEREVILAVLETKRIGRFADLGRDKAHVRQEGDEKIYALIKHLLVGHGGQPCPAGARPIISAQP